VSGVHAGSHWDLVWKEIFSSREWGKYPPEHVIRFVARNFYRAPDRKQVYLLEVGCGPGAKGHYCGFGRGRISGRRISTMRCIHGSVVSAGVQYDSGGRTHLVDLAR